MEMRYVLVALAVALTWAFRPEQHNFEPTSPEYRAACRIAM